MWQPILMISGYFISVLGLAMLVPAGVDIYYTQTNWSYFVTASIISLFIGLSLFLANNWISGTNTVLIDETKSIKYATISLFIEKLRLSYDKCPPFLLITKTNEIIIKLDNI